MVVKNKLNILKGVIVNALNISKIKSIFSWVLPLLITFIIVNFIGMRTIVCGSSMENNYYNGQNKFINRIVYKIEEPQRFDVISFTSNNEKPQIVIPFISWLLPNEDVCFIKRIIGLPGDNIRIDDEGNIFIDGIKLEENYGKEIIQDKGEFYDIWLSEDEYFVLGDNRNDSLDSRWIGPINKSQFYGRIN